jgi:inactivated superfamily I helicase
MKDQIIMSTDDLEDKLTEAWEAVNGYFLESVFHKWTSRLEQVTKHERAYYVT